MFDSNNYLWQLSYIVVTHSVVHRISYISSSRITETQLILPFPKIRIKINVSTIVAVWAVLININAFGVRF
jgi:hypothetical protein